MQKPFPEEHFRQLTPCPHVFQNTQPAECKMCAQPQLSADRVPDKWKDLIFFSRLGSCQCVPAISIAMRDSYCPVQSRAAKGEQPLPGNIIRLGSRQRTP